MKIIKTMAVRHFDNKVVAFVDFKDTSYAGPTAEAAFSVNYSDHDSCRAKSQDALLAQISRWATYREVIMNRPICPKTNSVLTGELND